MQGFGFCSCQGSIVLIITIPGCLSLCDVIMSPALLSMIKFTISFSPVVLKKKKRIFEIKIQIGCKINEKVNKKES